MIEVVDGLTAGNRVLLAPGEDLVARLPASVEAPGQRGPKVRRVSTSQPATTSAPTTEPAASQPAELPTAPPPAPRERRGGRRG